MPDFHEPIQRHVERVLKQRNGCLEVMAAAYLKLTSLPADRVELCEQSEPGLIRWWFRERADGPPPAPPPDGDAPSPSITADRRGC